MRWPGILGLIYWAFGFIATIVCCRAWDIAVCSLHEVCEADIAFELLNIFVIPWSIRIHADEEFIAFSGCGAEEYREVGEERFPGFPCMFVLGSHKRSSFPSSYRAGLRCSGVLADSVRCDYSEGRCWRG